MPEDKPNTITCPICGEQIEPEAAYHPHPLGGICIIDVEKSRKDGYAISAGQ